MTCAVLILIPHICYLTVLNVYDVDVVLFVFLHDMLNNYDKFSSLVHFFTKITIENVNHLTIYLPEAGAVFGSYHPQLYSQHYAC